MVNFWSFNKICVHFSTHFYLLHSNFPFFRQTFFFKFNFSEYFTEIRKKMNFSFCFNFFSSISIFFHLHELQKNKISNAYTKAESRRRRNRKSVTVWVCTGYFYKSLFQTTVNPGLNVTCEYCLLFCPAAAAVLATTALTVLCASVLFCEQT